MADADDPLLRVRGGPDPLDQLRVGRLADQQGLGFVGEQGR